MATDAGHDPIADEELLYRRIPVTMNWYVGGNLSPEAFDPRKDETTGISVSRAKYISVKQAAQGMSKKGYFVAILNAGELRKNGVRVEPRPLPDDPGHAELPDLTCDNRGTPETQARKVLLATVLTRQVEGPFPPALS